MHNTVQHSTAQHRYVCMYKCDAQRNGNVTNATTPTITLQMQMYIRTTIRFAKHSAHTHTKTVSCFNIKICEPEVWFFHAIIGTFFRNFSLFLSVSLSLCSTNSHFVSLYDVKKFVQSFSMISKHITIIFKIILIKWIKPNVNHFMQLMRAAHQSKKINDNQSF